MRRNPRWTEEEKSLLRKLYPEATQETILGAFPNKNWSAIKQYASGPLGLQRIRSAPGNPKRTITSHQAAKLIGMSYKHFVKLHAKEIPHDLAPNKACLFDPEEVKDWYRRELAEGRVVDKQLRRLPKEIASKQLRTIYQKLPMSAAEFAKKLKISLGAFRNYVEARYDIPSAILTEAEALFLEFQYGVLDTNKIPIERAAEELNAIQRRLGLTVAEFGELLRLPRNTLNSYLYPKSKKVKFVPKNVIQKAKKLAKTQLPKRHRASGPTEEMVRDALQEAGGVQTRAAAILKISSARLVRLISQYNLEKFVKQRFAIDRYSKKDVENALANAGGNITKAAKLLQVDRVTFYKLLRLSGMVSTKTHRHYH